MRLIDRDEMLSPKIWDMNIPNDIPKEVHDSIFELYNRLIHIPTVDAEPIIRCKECKYFMCGNGCILQAVDYSWEEKMYANDFCSRGERKDE